MSIPSRPGRPARTTSPLDADRLRRGLDAMSDAQRELEQTLRELHDQLSASLTQWDAASRGVYDEVRSGAADAEDEMAAILRRLRGLLDQVQGMTPGAQPENVRRIR